MGALPLVSAPVVVGLLALVLALAARAGTRNTYVKRKLVLSIGLSSAYLVAHLLLIWPGTPPTLDRTLQAIELVLLVLAVVNLVVVLAVNPYREDRLPAALPAILQDTITVGLFVIIGIAFFHDRVQLTAAAGAVVLGLALQDTLGNVVAGLALQADQPYRVGDWVKVGDHEGRVMQVSWRATVLRTWESAMVTLPNSSIATSPIVNYTEPSAPTRIWVDVGVSYQSPPSTVKTALLEALARAPMVLAQPLPEVLVTDFDSAAVTYRACGFIADMERAIVAQDQIRTAIWYAFQRHGLEIPYPIQAEYSIEPPSMVLPEQQDLPGLIGRSVLLGGLADEDRARLAASARPRMFALGEVVVAEGDLGRTCFLVARGEVRVTVGAGHEVARLGVGDVTGEMSWLTGDPRSATVTAVTDLLVYELDDQVLRALSDANPSVLETLADAVARRRQQLQTITADTAHRQLQVAEPRASLIARMKRFLRPTP